MRLLAFLLWVNRSVADSRADSRATLVAPDVSNPARTSDVVIITTADCRDTRPNTHREYGTQFAASLTILLKMKEVFPDWDAMLVTDHARWRFAGCRSVWDEFQQHYADRTGATLRSLQVDPKSIPVLDKITRSPGKETDHSRGHWPVEAYMHLVAPELLLARHGYAYTVYVDPDCYPRDDSLRFQIPLVAGVGVVSAIPPQCIVNEPDVRGLRGNLRAEYRLLSHFGKDVERAAPAGYAARNGTNSGLVVYNNEAMLALNWTRWLETLIDISPKGFYGDQTALTVAMGRADLHVHWLPPQYNVALTLPKTYVKGTCGADAVYSQYADPALGGNVSFAHFIWGSKPWMMQLTKEVRTAGLTRTNAVQADGPYANEYRRWALEALGPHLISTLFSPHAFDDLDLSGNHKPLHNTDVYNMCARKNIEMAQESPRFYDNAGRYWPCGVALDPFRSKPDSAV